MQTKNPLFEELAKAMESAVGLAQAAGEEARGAVRAQGDRLVAELDLVRRDELDAVKAVLTAEIAALREEIAGLRAAAVAAPPPAAAASVSPTQQSPS